MIEPVSIVAEVYHFIADLAKGSAFPVFFIMLMVGPLVEHFFVYRRARVERLNWLYAPLFLIFEVGFISGFFLTFSQLCSWLQIEPLFALPSFALSGHSDSFLYGFAGDLLALALFMLVVDAILYPMHRLQHQIPLLWTGHRLHHSDPQIDVTTTVRMHALDQLLKAILVAALLTILVRPPLLQTPALFLVPFAWTYYVHLNINVSHGRLWWLLNSPRFHLLHHEKIEEGIGCNFAVFFPLLDIIGGTARRERADDAIETGLPDWQPASLAEMIMQPLKDAAKCVKGGNKQQRDIPN